MTKVGRRCGSPRAGVSSGSGVCPNIPSETVFYEVIVNMPTVEEYCKHKNVVMASPNTFSYLLKIILVAYQQHELAKHANEILKAVAGIRVEAEKFDGDLSVLERHISNTYKSMDNVKVKYGKLFGKIESAQSIEVKEQAILIEKVEKIEETPLL